MKKNSYLLLFLLFLAACEGSESIVKHPEIVNQFDPSKPVAVNAIMPTFGGIDEPFVIEGNFKGDLEDMRVYFDDRKAVLVSTDGKSIMGMVPKQKQGKHSITVVCGSDSIVTDLEFKYNQTKSVKTIAGQFGDERYQDGDLNSARFCEVSNIATVKGVDGDNVITIEAWWRCRVCLVSLDDDRVVTLEDNGRCYGTPAVNNSRDKFYTLVHFSEDRTLYCFSRDDSWAAKSTNIVIRQQDMPGQIWSASFGGDDRYIYLIDSNLNFCRVDLELGEYEVIQLGGDFPWGNYSEQTRITYSKYHKCFLVTVPTLHGVYKLYEDNGDWLLEKYVGFNGSGGRTGHRLIDTQLTEPYSAVATSDGTVYIVNRSGPNIVKVDGDQVEPVAGAYGQWGEVNSSTDPLLARFNSPQDLAVDSEDNIYIAGGWDRTIRKLSIE